MICEICGKDDLDLSICCSSLGSYDDGYEEIFEKKSLKVYSNISFDEFKKKYKFDNHKDIEKCEKML